MYVHVGLSQPRLAHEEALNSPSLKHFLHFSNLGERDAIRYRWLHFSFVKHVKQISKIIL